MAITNYERVGRALEQLKIGLAPFVEREFKNTFGERAEEEILRFLGEDRINAKKPLLDWDVSVLLKIFWDAWHEVFKKTLGFSERSLVSELRDHRNSWAHQEAFSSDDTYRVLDSAGRLLNAISAPQSDEIEKMKTELLRLRFDEQVRGEMRKSSGATIESAATGQLKPWREVVTPHSDVAGGHYQQAEFAADLWQVHLGEGTAEYRDPIEFFRRTFLTESLKQLLSGAIQRLTGKGSDPVVQLQTSFGGGKTHSMLALYHLFSGKSPTNLPGLDSVLSTLGNPSLPKVRRVVLVGNKISPGNPVTKSDGTVVHTLWGEIAWQLGGAKAYQLIAADDQKATNPGDRLRELFKEYGPCLILIDEWVAYARQLHDHSDLPAGSFETQFTFAQALTESAKDVGNCLLVISLPASDTAGSPHTQVEDIEVGGQRGRESLERLRNVVGRVESSWRPASAEESFEIVSRRLFEPISEPAQFKDRDVVARAFADFYRAQQQEFPPECRDADYEKRLKAAYPIHPEIFDRLYTDWSSLAKFQRTRGVLRLMAAVIHNLWAHGDRNPLIMPANIPIGENRVQFELTRYLSDNWAPVIAKDVEGENSLPKRLDDEVPNLGRFAACRRVGRTIYLGSAPTTGAAHQGIEDRRIKLGCVMPGESTAIFGDALRRLASSATYLFQDGTRYWYSTQPTVSKLAEDRAEQYRREPDRVTAELERRLRKDLSNRGSFARVHPLPHSGHDVSDEMETRLVVLGIDTPYSREENCAAKKMAREILESRGNAPRIFSNALVFLAADKTRIQELDEALRKALAWASILEDKNVLNLAPQQVKQAEAQLSAVEATVELRLPETYQWLLVPGQSDPRAEWTWNDLRLTGQDPLAVRAERKLRHDELLIHHFAGSLLRRELDRIPLWRGDHVEVRQLADDFARYLYLPRLRSPDVLVEAIADGVKSLSWERETFAFADRFDEKDGSYLGLKVARQPAAFDYTSSSLLVKAEIAKNQLRAEELRRDFENEGLRATGNDNPVIYPPSPDIPVSTPARRVLRRFHGTVVLDSGRVGRDAGRIADEVISHLVGQLGAEVNVTLEIDARIPDGASDQIVRTVTENARTLKFSSQGFEEN